MPQKKNPFLNFCFSCWPGAGQMYQGFMKKGASIMTIFCVMLFFIALFDMDEFLVIMPVIWFYGFFDSINTNSLPDEKFASLKDEFLFVNNSFNTRQILKKFRLPVGVLFLAMGIYWICHSALYALAGSGFIGWHSRAFQLLTYVPKTFMALGVIAIGVCLIIGKRVQYDGRQEIPYGIGQTDGEPTEEKREGEGE